MSETTRNTILRAEGFSCPSCVTKIEKQVGNVPGVKNVKVRFATSKIEVEHDDTLSADDIVAAVGKAGYKARPSAF